MHTINTQWVLIAVAAGLIGFGVWLNYLKEQSERLRDRFGTEHDRTVRDLGSQTTSGSGLKARGRRVEGLEILPLTAHEAARSIRSWYGLQGRFINNPQNVIVQADQLVREVMLKRGYPMGDFERRAADISVDHPAVVHNYRAAQAIAVRAERGHANLEDLRVAVAYYHVLFDELLEMQEVAPIMVPKRQLAVHS
ncbi:MAG: hypothetical protein ACLPX1_05755 [Steroidobacteraceae bacterium]